MIASYQKDLLKNISSWLEILDEISKNTTDTSGLPKLEVSLRSGRLFSGSVVGLKKSAEENFLMLLEQADAQSKERIHLIQCEDISALSFIEPSTYLSIFSKPIISELELKRKTKSVEDQIEQILSKRISISLLLNSISDSNRGRILKMVEALPEIFTHLVKDDLGKRSVSSSIHNIGIEVAQKSEASLEDNYLKVSFTQDSETLLTKEKESLLLSIEKLF